MWPKAWEGVWTSRMCSGRAASSVCLRPTVVEGDSVPLWWLWHVTLRSSGNCVSYTWRALLCHENHSSAQREAEAGAGSTWLARWGLWVQLFPRLISILGLRSGKWFNVTTHLSIPDMETETHPEWLRSVGGSLSGLKSSSRVGHVQQIRKYQGPRLFLSC